MMAFSFAGIVSELEKKSIRIPVFVKRITGSTNDDARELAATCGGDFIVAADCQTGGKGTHGRSFFSPDRTGFYLTVALDGIAYDAPVVMAAAVAAVRTLKDAADREARIKWVNDIIYKGKKAAGILCERSGSGTVIVGIGMNLSEPEGGFPVEIRDTAAALDVPAEKADSLAAGFYAGLVRLLREESDTVADEYRRYCMTLGRRVKYVLDGDTVYATAEDIGPDGALNVALPDGTWQELTSGFVSVSVITEEEYHENTET